MAVEISQYKDFDGNIVKIGDQIERVDILTGLKEKEMGYVKSITKMGYIVLPITNLTVKPYTLGRHTRKSNV